MYQKNVESITFIKMMNVIKSFVSIFFSLFLFLSFGTSILYHKTLFLSIGFLKILGNFFVVQLKQNLPEKSVVQFIPQNAGNSARKRPAQLYHKITISWYKFFKPKRKRGKNSPLSKILILLFFNRQSVPQGLSLLRPLQ